jgi:hypothetical protein
MIRKEHTKMIEQPGTAAEEKLMGWFHSLANLFIIRGNIRKQRKARSTLSSYDGREDVRAGLPER